MIKQYRENLGLTQKELADKVGIDVSTLRNWETGRTGSDLLYKFSLLCKILNCTPEELIDDSEPLQ